VGEDSKIRGREKVITCLKYRRLFGGDTCLVSPKSGYRF